MSRAREETRWRKTARGGGSYNAAIRRVWSYGGLRSSPLSRNRELMQRIAETGYLTPDVICKCRETGSRLGETRKRMEHVDSPLSFSLLPSRSCSSRSSRLASRVSRVWPSILQRRACVRCARETRKERDVKKEEPTGARPVRSFFSSSPRLFLSLGISVVHLRRLFRQINNSSRLHAL